MLPDEGLKLPAIIFNKVDFPAPLSPIKPTVSDSFISKLTPVSAWIAPKFISMFFRDKILILKFNIYNFTFFVCFISCISNYECIFSIFKSNFWLSFFGNTFYKFIELIFVCLFISIKKKCTGSFTEVDLLVYLSTDVVV